MGEEDARVTIHARPVVGESLSQDSCADVTESESRACCIGRQWGKHEIECDGGVVLLREQNDRRKIQC